MKLQLGFEDNAYSARYGQQSPISATLKNRRPKTLSSHQVAYGQGRTVGQVAEQIEKKYALVETFYNLEEDFIVDNFERSYKTGMETGMSGGSWDVSWDPIPLEGKFRRSLTQRRFDGIIRGVPTRASLRGVSHLRADTFKQGASSRPSFVNTTLYMRSFKAWTEK